MKKKKIISLFIFVFCCELFFAENTDKLQIQMCSIPGTNYQLSSTEVTQRLFEEVTGVNPSVWKSSNYPVERVSFYDAVYFCNRLSVLMGYEPVYVIEGETDVLMVYQPFLGLKIEYEIKINEKADGFRLPTIDEWVYAAKGGENFRYAGSNNLDDVAIVMSYDPDESHEYEVAQKKSNGYGLYDMSGNVSEWVMDVYLYGEELNCQCGSSFASGYYEGDFNQDYQMYYCSRIYGSGDVGIRLLRANVKKSVSTNLRLRTNESKNSETICIIGKNSQVKIIEYGVSEIIDGIDSNWVKVEIISGKDWDGNIIKAGTTGWCYGGYLQ